MKGDNVEKLDPSGTPHIGASHSQCKSLVDAPAVGTKVLEMELRRIWITTLLILR